MKRRASDDALPHRFPSEDLKRLAFLLELKEAAELAAEYLPLEQGEAGCVQNSSTATEITARPTRCALPLALALREAGDFLGGIPRQGNLPFQSDENDLQGDHRALSPPKLRRGRNKASVIKAPPDIGFEEHFLMHDRQPERHPGHWRPLLPLLTPSLDTASTADGGSPGGSDSMPKEINYAIHDLSTGRKKLQWARFIEGWSFAGATNEAHAALGAAASRSAMGERGWGRLSCSWMSSRADDMGFGGQDVFDLAFRPLCGGHDPQLAAGASGEPAELQTWELLTGQRTKLGPGHNSCIQSLCYMPGGDFLISAGADYIQHSERHDNGLRVVDSTIRVWDPDTSECLHTLGPGDQEMGIPGHRHSLCSVTPLKGEGAQGCFASLCCGGQLLIWDAAAGALVGSLRSEGSPGKCVDVLAPMGDSKLASGVRGDADALFACCWDVEKGAQTACIAMPPARPREFRSTSRRIWDDYMESCEAQPNFHSMQGSPVNDNLLAVGLSSSWAAVADMRVPRKSSLVWTGFLGSEVNVASFSPCGVFLLAATRRSLTHLYDWRSGASGQPLHILDQGPPAPQKDDSQAAPSPGAVDRGNEGVNGAAWFHQHSSMMATVGGNGTVAVWDVSLASPALWAWSDPVVRKPMLAVTVSPDDRCIATGDQAQRICLYGEQKTSSRAPLSIGLAG